MLLSLFEKCRSRPVEVYVLVASDFSMRDKIREAIGRNAERVSFATIVDDRLSRLRRANYLTVASYYRVFMAEILPVQARRAIFLDCDLIVRADLARLQETELAGCIAAAVPDAGSDNGRTMHKLDLKPNALYFNSGVMLIDLERWRAEQVGDAVVRFAEEHPDQITWGDQCALNWVLRDSWKPLGNEWNVQTPSFGCIIDSELQYFRPTPPGALGGSIIHFTSPGKPWLYMSEHPFTETYRGYLAQTPWRDYHPPDRYPHNIIRRTLQRRAPWMLPVYMALRRYV
jgi:lipopolysaccharide biosynthesis glycosyltransferase